MAAKGADMTQEHSAVKFSGAEMFGEPRYGPQAQRSKTGVWRVYILKPGGALVATLKIGAPDRDEALRRARVVYGDSIPAGGDIEVEPSSTYSADDLFGSPVIPDGLAAELKAEFAAERLVWLNRNVRRGAACEIVPQYKNRDGDQVYVLKAGAVEVAESTEPPELILAAKSLGLHSTEFAAVNFDQSAGRDESAAVRKAQEAADLSDSKVWLYRYGGEWKISTSPIANGREFEPQPAGVFAADAINEGDRVRVTGNVQGQGKTGRVTELAPSGMFAWVKLSSGETRSYATCDLKRLGGPQFAADARQPWTIDVISDADAKRIGQVVVLAGSYEEAKAKAQKIGEHQGRVVAISDINGAAPSHITVRVAKGEGFAESNSADWDHAAAGFTAGEMFGDGWTPGNRPSGERWDSAKLGQRAEWVMAGKWVTGDGRITQAGERMAESRWDDLSPAARRILEPIVQGAGAMFGGQQYEMQIGPFGKGPEGKQAADSWARRWLPGTSNTLIERSAGLWWVEVIGLNSNAVQKYAETANRCGLEYRQLNG